jgi:hypothetical protein
VTLPENDLVFIFSSAQTVQSKTVSVVVFIPPPVEAGDAPIIIKRMVKAAPMPEKD